ncbi:hypothetical protein [Jannaschia marina]|uniref:hypothetical protein n=1 Tax=Jannaschia marina TaxID=2741674 RepID=UPI0015CD2AF0|nr:hypothetical protein [Jannaschia marina]
MTEAVAGAWRGGSAIFLAALRSILARPRLAVLLYLLFVVVDFGITEAQAQLDSALLGFLIALAFAVLVAAIACIWHRAVLTPGAAVPGTRAVLHYALAYLVLGIVGFLALAPFAMAYWYIGVAFGFSRGMFDAVVGTGGLLPAGVVSYAIGAWLFLMLIWRIGLGLPHIALGCGDVSFAESWRRTQPIAGSVVTLALIGAVAQLPFAFVGFALPYDTDALPYWVVSLASSLGYGVVVVVGAAILTELYRRTASR